MDPAYIIGFELSEEARACRGRHDASTRGAKIEACYLRALLAIESPVERRLHFRLRHCQAFRNSSFRADGFRWRQRVEATVARNFGVPLLRRHDLRIPRWDLHSGIVHAAYSAQVAAFDCLHSLRGDGAFDAEVSSLQEALEARFGVQRRGGGRGGAVGRGRTRVGGLS